MKFRRMRRRALHRVNIPPNTFWGNVGAFITNESQASSKLSGTTQYDIKNFNIDSNNNVSFYVGVQCNIAQNAFHHFSQIPITYFIHLGDAIPLCSATAFYRTVALYPSQIKLFIVRSLVTFYQNSHFRSDHNKVLEICATPKCTILGETLASNNVFIGQINIDTVYVDSSLATINAGNPDGDLTYVTTTLGGEVKYATNTNIPNIISTINVTNVASTSFDLDWIAPTSTNNIDWYLVFLNKIYVGKTNALNFSATGLTSSTSYTIEILALDEMGNCSNFSNPTTQITN